MCADALIKRGDPPNPMENNKQTNSNNGQGGSQSLPPRSADEAVDLINNLLQQRLVKEALEISDQSIRSWPNDVALLSTCALLAKNIGRTVASLELLKRAEKLGSESAMLQRQAIIDETAPYWHFRMMNDEVRNQAYDAALKHYVKADSIVLDIGCGAGLLSMMAARAGAKHVYACEVHELMHHQAEKIFKDNGFQDSITAIRQVSTQLKVGKHLPEKADIIVAEVFDTGLLGEKALSTFEHAREHLLKPGGKILPKKASVQAVLIESDLLHKESIVHECNGFKVEGLNELSPSYIQARLDAYPHKVLSEIQTVAEFDFHQSHLKHDIETIEIEPQTDGLAHAICFWFSLDFGHKNTLSTGPENEWNCWMQAISAFESPIPLTKGQLLSIDVHKTSDRISFKAK